MNKGKPRGRGRPKGSVAERTRTSLIQLKVFDEERAAYEDAARREGLAMSAWIRQQLNRVIRAGSEE